MWVTCKGLIRLDSKIWRNSSIDDSIITFWKPPWEPGTKGKHTTSGSGLLQPIIWMENGRKKVRKKKKEIKLSFCPSKSNWKLMKKVKEGEEILFFPPTKYDWKYSILNRSKKKMKTNKTKHEVRALGLQGSILTGIVSIGARDCAKRNGYWPKSSTLGLCNPASV